VALNFNIPPTVLVGAGAVGEIGPQLGRLGARRVLLVTDPYLAGTGLAARVAHEIDGAGIPTSTFAGVQPDPTEQNVTDGLAQYRLHGADALVALGGGSPIDCAKAIGLLTANPPPLSRYMGRHKVPQRGAPVIAVPTTAGTGSEVTKVAVITDSAREVKMMMLDRHLVPAAALVDYELTLSMPKALTAAVGVDTLTHGIEAYVSLQASPLTDPLALQCIRLCGEHLERAWNEPAHRAAREGMMFAATLGGMAFSNSSVALVHGMSRPIGALFHVPHGISNAMLLPTVTRFSAGAAVARYATIARTLGWAGASDRDEPAVERLLEGLFQLNRRLEIPRLRDYPGLDAGRFARSVEILASDALASGSPANNPVVATAAQIAALYREAW
jgi:alcohol dehydrogenase class IV